MRRAFHSFILESDEKTSTEDFDFLYEHGLIGLSEYYDATKSLPGIEPSTELRLDGQDQSMAAVEEIRGRRGQKSLRKMTFDLGDLIRVGLVEGQRFCSTYLGMHDAFGDCGGHLTTP